MTKRMPTILAYAALVIALAFGFAITTAHSTSFAPATTVATAQF